MASSSTSEFTDNVEIDSTRYGDKLINLVGYVDEIENDRSFHHSKYYKIVINNGRGRRVQVVAWNDHFSAIDKITRLCTIVHAKNLLACKPANSIYNLGNVHFELHLQSDSTITNDGIYYHKHCIIPSTIADSVNKIGSKIRIDGYVKTPFEKRKKGHERYFLGSITDSYHQLDVKIMADAYITILKTGQPISIVGVMENNPKKPPRLCVDRMEHITLLNMKYLPLSVIYLGNRYPRSINY